MQAFLEKFSFENNKQINIYVWFLSSQDCIDKLFAFIENRVCYIKRIFSDVYVPCIMGKEDKRCHEHATECFMCGRNFVGNPHLDKVRDHCHLSGKFHFTLCSNCNLTHTK